MSSDPYVIEGVKSRQPQVRTPWARIILIAGAVIGVAAIFSPLPGKIIPALRRTQEKKGRATVDTKELERQIEDRLHVEMEAELAAKIDEFKKQMAKSTTVLQQLDETSPSTGGDVKKMRNGIPFHSDVLIEKGSLASIERTSLESYTASYQLRLKVPKPSQTIEDLKKSSPDIERILPKLTKLLEKADVSKFYTAIYDNKVARIKKDATRLFELLSKENFYDLETILNLRDPDTSRRIFLMQSEMDVVSDGSDGDRLAAMPAEIVDSTNYQPFTSYGWKKQSTTPNPIIEGWKKRVVAAEAELALPTTTAARKVWLKERVVYLNRGIADMKARSFLVAEYDPFIVIPVSILADSNDANAPKIGDYAVVIHDGKLYPSLVGDGGPTYKVGEASLRMAKQLNARSTPYSRPVSDLKVTYLIFPGSRDAERSAPDYAKWSTRCEELLKEIGGVGEGYSLHTWESTFPKP